MRGRRRPHAGHPPLPLPLLAGLGPPTSNTRARVVGQHTRPAIPTSYNSFDLGVTRHLSCRGFEAAHGDQWADHLWGRQPIHTGCDQHRHWAATGPGHLVRPLSQTLVTKNSQKDRAMKLYMHPVSMTSRPVRLFIAENGLEVEEVLVDLMTGEHHKEPFVSINPNRLVPVLDDGDLRLTESSAILKYLADKIDSPLYPKDLKKRGKVNE